MPIILGKSGIYWNYDLDGEGRNLLFLHGWGVDRRIWRQQTKHFSQNYQVMSIDLPGHGKSTWENISLARMSEDMIKMLVKFMNGKVTIVASSLGGLFALKMYEGLPEKIDRIVMVGSMPKFAQCEDYPYGLDVAAMRKLGDQLETAYPSMVDIFFRSLFTKEERQTRRYKWLQKFRQFDEKPIKSALLEYLDILEQEDLRDVLAKVEVPMQFINGTDDEICKKEFMNYVRQIKPDARYDFFDKCGHFPFLSKPYEFNDVLEDFLNETEHAIECH